MANQKQKTRTTKQTHSDDEIDLLELLHFLVKGAPYWLSGGVIFGFLGVIYALNFYPYTFKQQTINDIDLNQESLSLVRQVMPALTVPLEDKMMTQGLGGLYGKITKGGQAYLDKVIFGVSGIDIKDKTLDRLSKEKIETVVIMLKGDNHDLAMNEIDFIRNNIRGVSQYLEVKKYINDEISNAKIKLFNAKAEVNKQQLNYERSSRMLQAYQALQKESDDVRDLQIILNLSNKPDSQNKEEDENEISEFSGAKYLPLGNRMVGLKSEMANYIEAKHIAQLQIKALKLSQKLLNDLSVTFNKIPYQGDVIDFVPMMQLLENYREQKTDYTQEEITTLDDLERQLIDFDQSRSRFTNSLPLVVEKGGRLYLVLIIGFTGAFVGFLVYVISSLVNVYSRRYKN